ncbi:TetR/AcrR family transcriptional regulator [Agrococcus terreus]|uniref:TetR family transcriptional regulator n=1 Tax=Agrococcus terreus TaxID=574649 RepID=A0ABQ2KCT8_9MICO|nr:TetR family transcriptional regulator [Agrococcus terreus]GGN77849.1 TetR family transcriptional regulator [Agrococcus terreus]
MSEQVRRRDAERNRARILEVAAERIEAGESVAHKDLARAAEVGVGTVYRAFPARPDLIAALAEPHLRQLAALVRSAVDADDPLEVAVVGAVALLGQHPDVAEQLRAQAGEPDAPEAVVDVVAALDELVAHLGDRVHQGVTGVALAHLVCAVDFAAELAHDDGAARRLQLSIAVQGLRGA